jgi:hypothetical protein
MTIERQEFGHLIFPTLNVLFIIALFMLFCLAIDLQEYERKAKEKQEWLKTHTPDGLKYTYTNENLKDYELN